jgi:hypothetical protein
MLFVNFTLGVIDQEIGIAAVANQIVSDTTDQETENAAAAAAAAVTNHIKNDGIDQVCLSYEKRMFLRIDI